MGTIPGDSGIGTYGSGLAADPGDNTLRLTPDGANGTCYTVDKDRAAVTSQGTLNGPDDGPINSLAWTCDGETLYGTHNFEFGAPSDRELITSNTAADTITSIGAADRTQEALAFDCSPPPPPPPLCKGQPAALVSTTGMSSPGRPPGTSPAWRGTTASLREGDQHPVDSLQQAARAQDPRPGALAIETGSRRSTRPS